MGNTQEYFYDAEGQIKSKNSFEGTSTVITYSSDRTVRTTSYSDGTQSKMTYNALGLIEEAENEYGKTVYEYDKGGKLVRQTDVTTGEVISFIYDAAGNRTKLLSSNRETVYNYGKNNEVIEVFDNKQRMDIKLKYDVNGRETERKFSNGVSQNTSYDKAGRVILMTQKTSGNEITWGEAYLYGADGKRTATADINGTVTLYEYDAKGQLSTVYYPYTKAMEVALKEEAEENRMPSSTDCAVNKYLDSGIRDELSALLNRISWNYGSKILAMQLFIKESYNYDRNGNRTQKITPYGTIDYTYNEENFLISSGWNGNTGVSYTYDKEGNLLTQESELKTVKYAYNSMNRIMYSEVTDKKEKTHSVSYYGYDAFGRRVIEQDKDEAALRSLYDGFTFDVIKQSPTFTNGLFVDSNEIGIRISRTGRPTGDRYRYLEDTPQQDGNRYFHLDEGNYRNVSSRYKGSRTTLSVNGTIAAQNADDDISYFTTDLLGSVRNTTDGYGYVDKKYTYDAFGAIIEGDLSGQQNFGYLGKQFDSQTGLYNYGYRDYTPKVARFTTVDPIRDGENWLTYCKNDSVNHVDLWGLETTEYQKAITKVLAEHAVYDIDLQNYIKTNTTIEVVRSSLDNGNNGQYFKSTVSVKVGDIVLNESKIQSTADHPYLNDGKPKHEGRTIEPGEYTGTLLNKSHSYNKAISISGNGVEQSEGILFHPNAMTALGSRDSYGQGDLKGRPLSLACQIQILTNHEEMTDILESIGLKFGNGKSEKEWTSGDKVIVLIIDNTETKNK